jgi:hypothetical protein
MPVIPGLHDVFARSAADGTSSGATGVNGTAQSLHVVCAWPVSSQYGAGSRFLYAPRSLPFLLQADVLLKVLCSCSHLRIST